VKRLRKDVLPVAVGGTGATELLTGRTAMFDDISSLLTSRLPSFIAGVALLSFLLLMIVFRSVLVPLKAALMRSGDSHTSVVDGLASTARVITSAALIMISVFLAFVTSMNVTIKMFGLGLAAAVLIDATLVRMVLVPATMSLLGKANWWLPRWLDRVLPRMDLEGTTVEPEEHQLPELERIAA
jgi:uncharacterized membrane protein YdfJ with MMPL/SSD domain